MSELEFTNDELKLFDEKIQRCVEQLVNLSFNKRVFRHQIVVGLALSVVERAHTVLLLLKESKVFDAEIIVRSLLEHFVELKNCIDDNDYQIHFQKPFFSGMKRRLVEAKEGNPYFSEIARKMDLDKELGDIARKISETEKIGGKEIKSQAKFHRAGMKHEYDSIFRSTSSQVHPSFSGIINRHFEVDYETDDFDVIAFAIPSRSKAEPVLQTTIDILEELPVLIAKFEAELVSD